MAIKLSTTNTTHKIPAEKSLDRSSRIAYALPVMGVSFLMGPLTILQGIYAKYFGVALTTIATVLLITRLFDAIADPMIGYWADRYYARHGSHKPFILCGGVLFIVSSYFLYVPIGLDALQDPFVINTEYFLGWFLAFYLAYTLFEIPHLAWGGALCSSSQDKNKIYGWRAMGSFSGSLLFFMVPLLPVFETSQFTPQTLQWSVLLVGTAMLPILFFCMKIVPSAGDNGVTNRRKKESVRDLISSLLGNPPLLWFLVAFFCTGTGVGMCLTLMFLFVDSYLLLGDGFALVYVISYGFSTLTLGMWPRLANHWGKQRGWGLAVILLVIGLTSTVMLTPGEASTLPLLLCMALMYCGFAGVTVIAPSLLADIIDYGTWKFGRDRAGIYFSLYTLVTKTNFAIGGALGLGIIGAFGFDATANIQTTEAIFGLHLGMVWLPVPLVLLSILFIGLVSINADRHAIIRHCLDFRSTRRFKDNKLKKRHGSIPSDA